MESKSFFHFFLNSLGDPPWCSPSRIVWVYIGKIGVIGDGGRIWEMGQNFDRFGIGVKFRVEWYFCFFSIFILTPSPTKTLVMVICNCMGGVGGELRNWDIGKNFDIFGISVKFGVEWYFWFFHIFNFDPIPGPVDLRKEQMADDWQAAEIDLLDKEGGKKVCEFWSDRDDRNGFGILGILRFGIYPTNLCLDQPFRSCHEFWYTLRLYQIEQFWYGSTRWMMGKLKMNFRKF